MKQSTEHSTPATTTTTTVAVVVATNRPMTGQSW